MVWHSAGNIDNYPVNESRSARVADKLIALFNVDGTLYATDAFCTHLHARLVQGRFENGQVECPVHQGRFDVKTGKALCAPLTRDLRCYSVRIEGNQVLVDLA